MKSAKSFLAIFAVLYVGGAIAINFALGPPGYSKAYLEEFEAVHSRFMAIEKSGGYKLWRENADRNPADGALEEDYKFADNHRESEPYRAEIRRRGNYENLLDVFNIVMLAVLVVRFARRPLTRLLDSQIEAVRGRIESSAALRQKAEALELAARRKLDGLDGERATLENQTRKQIEENNARFEEDTRLSLELLAQETADRIHQEESMARARLKEELIDRAIERLTERYRGAPSPEDEARLIGQFVRQLETSE